MLTSQVHVLRQLLPGAHERCICALCDVFLAPVRMKVSEAEIRRALKGEKEAETMKGTLLARFDFLDDN